LLGLLDFPTPNGLSLALSSLPSPNFATSYNLDSIGVLDGSISYLYSSLPLQILHRSNDIPLRHIIPGYKQLQELQRPDEAWWWEIWHGGKRIDRRDTLLYGRLYLPTSHLEALYLRRISPVTQLKISAVSSNKLRSGGSILFLLSQDHAKYSTEYLYSTDSALLGVRGLYNFGPDPRKTELYTTPTPDNDDNNNNTQNTPPGYRPNGRFSAGAEIYYGVLNKSGGMSTGFRFATLPQHTGFPYTMTLTINPLMGNLTSTYAVKAGRHLALCSKFDFNVYSYESGFTLGMELWRRRTCVPGESLDWAYSILDRPGAGGWGEAIRATKGPLSDQEECKPVIDALPRALVQGTLDALDGFDNENTSGVLKARVNQDGELGVLWEGKLKELLYSFGVHVDFKQREQIFRGVGLQIQYSS
jgi:mitochondrial distribution and morphology protein 10